MRMVLLCVGAGAHSPWKEGTGELLGSGSCVQRSCCCTHRIWLRTECPCHVGFVRLALSPAQNLDCCEDDVVRMGSSPLGFLSCDSVPGIRSRRHKLCTCIQIFHFSCRRRVCAAGPLPSHLPSWWAGSQLSLPAIPAPSSSSNLPHSHLASGLLGKAHPQGLCL